MYGIMKIEHKTSPCSHSTFNPYTHTCKAHIMLSEANRSSGISEEIEGGSTTMVSVQVYIFLVTANPSNSTQTCQTSSRTTNWKQHWHSISHRWMNSKYHCHSIL